MSQVISFRLDRNNPRDAQALAVLATKQEQGYSVRHILTEALTRLAEDEHPAEVPVADMKHIVSQMAQLLEQMQSGEFVTNRNQKRRTSGEKLSEAFLASVSQASKPGVRLE